jgi:RNA polymerase sigma factor (TIGR02999 family)
MSDVTRLLGAAAAGDRRAAADLLPLVYDELRALASARMANEAPEHTLQPTALVHEAYLRLVGSEDAARWDNRGHFFAAAAEAMRRVLVDRARARHNLKRGGNARRVALDGIAACDPDERLLALDEALTTLAASDPLTARVVELHHFGGLSHEQVADALEVTVYLARQKWTFARAWLKTALSD